MSSNIMYGHMECGSIADVLIKRLRARAGRPLSKDGKVLVLYVLTRHRDYLEHCHLVSDLLIDNNEVFQ